VPSIREPKPGLSPLHFFGTEVRHAREEAKMTQAELGVLCHCDDSTVSRVEGGLCAPPDGFAEGCDKAFPYMRGWFARFWSESRTWGENLFPKWFEDWLNHERKASLLRNWQPIIVPGLLQTADYARALYLAAQSDIGDAALDQLVAARLARQGIFDTPESPRLLAVLDEAVLHRLVGTPKTMHDQLVQIADMSMRSCISVQVVPASIGANAGLGGAFTIATVDGRPEVMHVEAVEGITVYHGDQVRKTAIVFDMVRGDALPRRASRDLILKMAEEKWNC
jgi:hypothetical protein